jgi:hypothetical protein
MCDAKRFTEDTGKSGGGTGRSGIHGNSERGDTGRFVNMRYRRDLRKILWEIQKDPGDIHGRLEDRRGDTEDLRKY